MLENIFLGIFTKITRNLTYMFDIESARITRIHLLDNNHPTCSFSTRFNFVNANIKNLNWVLAILIWPDHNINIEFSASHFDKTTNLFEKYVAILNVVKKKSLNQKFLEELYKLL